MLHSFSVKEQRLLSFAETPEPVQKPKEVTNTPEASTQEKTEPVKNALYAHANPAESHQQTYDKMTDRLKTYTAEINGLKNLLQSDPALPVSAEADAMLQKLQIMQETAIQKNFTLAENLEQAYGKVEEVITRLETALAQQSGVTVTAKYQERMQSKRTADFLKNGSRTIDLNIYNPEMTEKIKSADEYRLRIPQGATIIGLTTEKPEAASNGVQYLTIKKADLDAFMQNSASKTVDIRLANGETPTGTMTRIIEPNGAPNAAGNVRISFDQATADPLATTYRAKENDIPKIKATAKPVDVPPPPAEPEVKPMEIPPEPEKADVKPAEVPLEPKQPEIKPVDVSQSPEELETKQAEVPQEATTEANLPPAKNEAEEQDEQLNLAEIKKDISDWRTSEEMEMEGWLIQLKTDPNNRKSFAKQILETYDNFLREEVGNTQEEIKKFNDKVTAYRYQVDAFILKLGEEVQAQNDSDTNPPENAPKEPADKKEETGSGEVEKEGSRLPGTPETSKEGSGEGEKGVEKKLRKEPKTQGELLEQNIQDSMDILNDPKSSDKDKLKAGIILIMSSFSWLRGEFEQTNGNALPKKGQETKDTAGEKTKEQSKDAKTRVMTELKAGGEGLIGEKLAALKTSKEKKAEDNAKQMATNAKTLEEYGKTEATLNAELTAKKTELGNEKDTGKQTQLKIDIQSLETRISGLQETVKVLKANNEKMTADNKNIAEDLLAIKDIGEKIDSVKKTIGAGLNALKPQKALDKYEFKITDKGALVIECTGVTEVFKKVLKEANIAVTDAKTATVDLENTDFSLALKKLTEGGTPAEKQKEEKPEERRGESPESLGKKQKMAERAEAQIRASVYEQLGLGENTQLPERGLIRNSFIVDPSSVPEDGRVEITFNKQVFENAKEYSKGTPREKAMDAIRDTMIRQFVSTDANEKGTSYTARFRANDVTRMLDAIQSIPKTV